VFAHDVGLGSLESDQAVSAAQPAAEASSLEELYRAHHDFVWRNARRLGCDDDGADDVVHEVFLVARRKLVGFENRSSIRTWLFAITHRIIQRMRRDRARYDKRLRAYAAEQTTTPALEPHAQSEAADTLRHLLAQLDEPKRVVFILAELEGMSSVEIGQCLGVKPPTVDSRRRAARIALTKMLRRDRAREGSRVT
jgi:RNA polymerase sigma-70 factor (ECF subfamily)